MAFTKEEFDIMVDELLYREKVSFDMLCKITDKTLTSRIGYLCRSDKYMRGRDFEKDIMQLIYLRVMQKTVSRFLLKDGVDGPVNNDPDGFRKWLNRLGENVFKDYAAKVRNRDFTCISIDPTDDDDDGNNPPPVIIDGPTNPPLPSEANEERLREAFSIVLSANVSIYKILTWLALNLIVYQNNEPKIEAKDFLLEKFEERTLNDMYAVVVSCSKRIPWMEITPEQHAGIIKKLNKKRNSHLTFGEMQYKEFFMIVNGEKSGKKSVSDWVYRLNEMIKKKMSDNN